MEGRIFVGIKVFKGEVICMNESSCRKKGVKAERAHGVYHIVPTWASGAHRSEKWSKMPAFGGPLDAA